MTLVDAVVSVFTTRLGLLFAGRNTPLGDCGIADNWHLLLPSVVSFSPDDVDDVLSFWLFLTGWLTVGSCQLNAYCFHLNFSFLFLADQC